LDRPKSFAGSSIQEAAAFMMWRWRRSKFGELPELDCQAEYPVAPAQGLRALARGTLRLH
jgi:hypothetical protein